MIKFLKYLFLTIFTLVFVVVIGAIIFIKTFDLNKYKGLITKLVAEQTGRQLEIKGDASLGISLSPTIILEDVEFSNALWAKNTLMVKVKKVSVSFEILPLLDKQIVIDDVVIEGPEIFLEKNKQGEVNWDFSGPEDVTSFNNLHHEVLAFAQATVEEKDYSADLEDIKDSFVLKGLIAKDVSISNGFVEYDDYASGKPIRVDIKSLTLDIEGQDVDILVNLNIAVDGEVVQGKMKLGSISKFLEGDVYPVNVDLQAYGAAVQAVGTLVNITDNLTYDLAVKLNNPAGNMGAPSVLLNSKVVGGLAKVSLDINLLDVATNKITGTVSADISGKIPNVTANLQSNSFDVRKLSNTKTAFVLPEVITSAEALTFVPNDKVPYELLKEANAKVVLNVKSLVLSPDVHINNLSANADLKNSILTLNPVKLNFEQGKVNVVSVVNGNNKTVSLKIKSENIIVQDVYKKLAVRNKIDFGVSKGGAVELDVDVVTSGATYRQLSDKISGRMVAILSPSTLQTGKVPFVLSDFLNQVLKAIKFSGKANSNLDLTCAVLRADFKEGKAEFPQGIAVETKQLNIVSDGKINLVNDKIDFTLQPFSGSLTDASITQTLSSFMKIRGTLEDPKLVLDNKQALQTVVGVALAAPVYVGGAMVLGGNAAPCYTALQGTSYANRFPKPTGATAKTQKVYQGVTDTVEQSGKKILDTINVFGGKKRGN